MSLALKKLREYFGDELVHYERGISSLTPLARELKPEVSEILRLSSIVSKRAHVAVPEQKAVTILLTAPSCVLHSLLPRLLARIAIEQPHISLRSTPLRLYQHASKEVDLTLAPDWLVEGTGSNGRAVFDETFSCLVRADFGMTALSEEHYKQSFHAALDDTEEAVFWSDGNKARELLACRRIDARVSELEALRHLVASRGLVVTSSTRFVQQQAALSPRLMAVLAPPSLTSVSIVATTPERTSIPPAVRQATDWIVDAAASV